jgi:hypothetical protein
MTRNVFQKTFPLFLIAMAAAAQTPAEREHAVKYLTETRNSLSAAVAGLSDAQWNFKPSPDKWSIAQIVEHLAVTEDLISKKVLIDIKTAPAPAADRDAKQVDSTVVAKMTDRTTKYQAPEPIQPTGRWAHAEALQHLLDSRAQTIALVESTPGLRDHVIAHPAFGPLDGYEWALATAGHSARHTQQILEVKADPNFPVK